MASDPILDPFHRQLAAALLEEIENRKDALARGSAMRISDGTSSVTENYAAQTAWIGALLAVLERCAEIEREQMGAGVRPSKTTVEYA